MLQRIILVLLVAALAGPAAYAQQAPARSTVEGARAELAAKTDRVRSLVSKLVPQQAVARLLESSTNQSWDGTAWVNEFKTVNSYDGGQLSQQSTFTWDGAAWVNASRTSYTNAGGKIVAIQNDEWADGGWLPTQLTTFEYDGDLLTRLHYQSWIDGAWVNESRVTYSLLDGRIHGYLEETWDGSAWVNADRTTVTEENGNVVQISESWEDGAWVNDERVTWMNVTFEHLYDLMLSFFDEEGAHGGLAMLAFLPDATYEDWDGTQWVNESRQVTTRDDSGRPATVAFESWMEGTWVGDSQLAFTYSAEGRLASLSWQMFDGETWTDFMIETLVYDSLGDLREALIQLNFGAGLTNTSRILFTYVGDTGTGTGTEEEALPAAYELGPAYPNPFNPATTLTVRIEATSRVTVRVYDLTGRPVATLVDGVLSAGTHDLRFDAAGLPSGSYLVRMEAPGVRQVQPVVLVK